MTTAKLGVPPAPAVPYRAIAEFTYDWESWIDAAGYVRWVNPAVERLTGYTVAECLQQPDYPMRLIHPEDRERVEGLLRRALQGDEGNHVEFRILRKDGQVRWGAISWQPLTDAEGCPAGFRTSVRDIDARKRMEVELRSAMLAAQAASQAKSQFLATVSHELRTPLQSIVGYAELLVHDVSNERHRRQLQVMSQQCSVLEALVEELLDFASVGDLPLHMEAYAVEDLVERVIHGLAPLASRKGLRLDSQIARCDTQWGDAHRIAQILRNLIGNAIKFTPEGFVRVDAHEDEGASELVFFVDDSGPGLPDLESVFEPFAQGPTPMVRQGVGLGLALSRQLAQRMGGTLTGGTNAAGGARLTLRLPLRRAVPSAPLVKTERPLPAASEASAARCKVLVVDDVEAARQFVVEAVAALGHEAVGAAGGREALERAEETRFDLAFVDIEMPEIGGWELATTLRRRYPRLRLVALTAQSLTDDVQLRASGFDGHVAKPIHLGELRVLLGELGAEVHQGGAALPLSAERPSSPPGHEPLDPARRAELARVTTADGESLLIRTYSRVLDELPLAVARARAATSEGRGDDTRRAVHDVSGLLALVGATAARRHAMRAEELLVAGENADGALEALDAELVAVYRALGRARSL